MNGPGIVIYQGTDAGVETLLRRGLAKLQRPVPVVGLRGGLPRPADLTCCEALVMDLGATSSDDGCRLAWMIRQDHPEVPIILFDGKTADARAAVQAGVNDLIPGRGQQSLTELLVSVNRQLADPARARRTAGAGPLGIAIVRFDAKGTIVHADARAGELLGWKPAALRGQKLSGLVKIGPGDFTALMRGEPARSMHGVELELQTCGGGSLPVRAQFIEGGSGGGSEICFQPRAASSPAALPPAALFQILSEWPAPVIITGVDGSIRHANGTAERLLRYPQGALAGVGFNSLIIDERTPEPAGRLSRIMRRSNRSAGVSMRLHDGGTVPVSWVVLPLDGGAGSLAIGRDLTSLRSAEREVMLIEQRFQRLIRASLDGILVVRLADGVVMDVNPGLSRALGLAPAEWRERRVWEINPLCSAIPDAGALAALSRRTLMRRDELALRHANGETRAMEFSTHLAVEGSEQLLICNFRDLSELKLREAQAKRRAEQLELLGEIALHASHSLEINTSLADIASRLAFSLNARIAILLHDEHDANHLRVAATSGAWPDSLAAGMPLNPEAARYFEQLPADAEIPVRPLAEAQSVEAGLLQSGVQRLLITPLLMESRTAGRVVLAREKSDHSGITDDTVEFLIRAARLISGALRNSNLYGEVQKAYVELQNTQERVIAQERLRALGTMASGIAHDFNNALSPILGFSELLLDNPDILDDRARSLHYLELIRTGAMDGSSVVSRLREFYRHRERPDTLLPVQLNAMVTGVIEMTRPRWRDIALSQGAPVSIRTELGDIPPLNGHESELREMLTNLVLNALDAMPEGGELCISTDLLPSGRIVVEVGDTGSGMSEDVRRRCLEPFFSTKGERGTGLGLAMVYGTVQRHAGCIDITSAEGHGTTVSVYLPAVAGTASEAPEAPQTATGPLGVLVAEDNPAIRELLRDQLTADGHSVTLAADGVEALRMYSPEAHQIVITDRAMPLMSGCDLARRLKALPQPPRVIMLSGFGEIMMDSDGGAAAVDLVLRKPLSRHRLRGALIAGELPHWNEAGNMNLNRKVTA